MPVPFSVPSMVFTWFAGLDLGILFISAGASTRIQPIPTYKNLASCITKAICLQESSTLPRGLPDPISSPIVLHLAHLTPAP